MADLATLQDRLEKLRKTRASGAREVEFQASNGQKERVVFRSDNELAAAIADLERQIAAATAKPIRTIRLTFSKGLDR